MADPLHARAAAMSAAGTMATARHLLGVGTAPLEDTFGSDVADRTRGGSAVFARARALLDEGASSSVDAPEELFALGLPAGLPGGLALVAVAHRATLISKVSATRALKATMEAAAAEHGRFAQQKAQTRLRKRGEYDRKGGHAERRRLALLAPDVGQLAQRLSSSVSAARRAGGAPKVLGGARSRGWDQVGRTTLPDRVSRPRRSVCSISAHEVDVRCSSSVCAAALVAADRGSSRGMTTRTRRRSVERRDRSPLSVCGAGDPRSGLCSHRHPRA